MVILPHGKAFPFNKFVDRHIMPKPNIHDYNICNYVPNLIMYSCASFDCAQLAFTIHHWDHTKKMKNEKICFQNERQND